MTLADTNGGIIEGSVPRFAILGPTNYGWFDRAAEQLLPASKSNAGQTDSRRLVAA